ncbi:MAG: serine hydroxymethyltransferase [Rhizobiales bacterium]|nr:serine hydroxymethyltransferase [Hyphomicrobiales bacterium]
MGDGTFLIEFLQIGPQIKVTAIDPDSGIEVSIIAPLSASKAEMSRVAANKLKRRIAKLAESQDEKPLPSEGGDSRGGLLI